MIRGIKIVNHSGEELCIDMARPEESGFVIESIDGLGPVKANVNVTEMATNDGGKINSSRLPVRNINFHFIFYELFNAPMVTIYNISTNALNDILNNGEVIQSDLRTRINLSVEDLRHISYRFFQVKKEIKIYIYTDKRSFYTSGTVESNDPDIFSSESGCSVSVICPYPYFISIEDEVETSFGSVIPEIWFDRPNDIHRTMFSASGPSVSGSAGRGIPFSSISQITENVIYYEGDIETGIRIEIGLSGRIGDLEISNVTKNETFKLIASKIETILGSEIDSGDRIVINSLRGMKKILYYRNGVEYNILNAMGKKSDWLMISNGNNLFRYSAETGIEYANFSVYYPILYEGI